MGYKHKNVPTQAEVEQTGWSSLNLAKRFKRRHCNILRAIDDVLANIADTEFARDNFTESLYLNARGKKCRCYRLTRAAMRMVALGFNGKDAAKVKIRM